MMDDEKQTNLTNTANLDIRAYRLQRQLQRQNNTQQPPPLSSLSSSINSNTTTNYTTANYTTNNTSTNSTATTNNTTGIQSLPPLPPSTSPTSPSSTVSQIEAATAATAATQQQQQAHRMKKYGRKISSSTNGGRKLKHQLFSTGHRNKNRAFNMNPNDVKDETEIQNLTGLHNDDRNNVDDNYENDDIFYDYSNQNQAHNSNLKSITSVLKTLFKPFTTTSSYSRSTITSLLFFLLAVLFLIVFINRKYLWVLYLRRSMNIPAGLYSKDGHLYVGKDTRFFIKGVSWFGMEEENHVLRGLDRVSVAEVMTFLKQHNFNAIRLPLSLENLKNNPDTNTGISTFHNPELTSLNYRDTIQFIVTKAAEQHLLVLLDIHRLHNKDVMSSGVWYTKDLPEEELLNMWETLANEFSEHWNILGADLYNEPWNATWNNDSKDESNWKRMVETLAEKIHSTCPKWLLFIEGVGNRAGNVTTNCFWSENLHAMQHLVPDIQLQNKFVFSPHVYGPSVYMQDYFKKDNFTDEMPRIWDDHFGEASKASGIPTVIGEWGGTLKDMDEAWQKKFFKYLKEKEIGFFYWCLNPESGDTGGLLKEDWKSAESKKLELIAYAPSTNVEPLKEHFVQT